MPIARLQVLLDGVLLYDGPASTSGVYVPPTEPTPSRTPFVGAIVHFVDPMGVHSAAIVTDASASDGSCSLTVFGSPASPNTSVHAVASAPHVEPPMQTIANPTGSFAGPSWHWPEAV